MPGPSPQDSLQPFSFGGVVVPCEDLEVDGGLRDHVHEYSHVNGGDPEKLGRSLYQVNATLAFQGKLKRYPNLWPNTLNTLLKKWESGATDTLVIPSRGVINAYAFKWTTKWSARVRSGERVTVRFREDGKYGGITVTLPSPASIATGASSLAATLLQAQGLDANDLGLFAALQTVCNSLTAIEDTASLYGNLVAARVAQLASMCDQLDNLTHLQSPQNWPVVDALHELWASCVQFGQDIQRANVSLQLWIVPTLMGISTVSVNLYGDSSQVTNLLALNTGAFDDPLNIPAGTELAYYPGAPVSGGVSANASQAVSAL